MDGGEFGVEDFGLLVLCCVERSTGDWFEDIQKLARCWSRTVASFRGQRQRVGFGECHCLTQFPLQQRLQYQREEVDRQQADDNGGHRRLDFLAVTKPSPRALQSLTHFGAVLNGFLHSPRTCGRVRFGLASTMKPEQPIAR